MAVSSRKYIDYGDIDYDDQKLVNNAISIHKLLYEKLGAILGIQLREWALMLPEHREVASMEGILDIAVIARKPEREIPDDWSVEVTKDLAVRILRNLPEFSWLFNNAVPIQDENPVAENRHENTNAYSSEKSPDTSTSKDDESKTPVKPLSKPSQYGHDSTRSLKEAVELLFEQDPDHVLMATKIYVSLVKKKSDPKFKIKHVEGSGTKADIIFNCGHKTHLHAARPHIQKIITWLSNKTNNSN